MGRQEKIETGRHIFSNFHARLQNLSDKMVAGLKGRRPRDARPNARPVMIAL
jgi:hypothetical protein